MSSEGADFPIVSLSILRRQNCSHWQSLSWDTSRGVGWRRLTESDERWTHWLCTRTYALHKILIRHFSENRKCHNQWITGFFFKNCQNQKFLEQVETVGMVPVIKRWRRSDVSHIKECRATLLDLLLGVRDVRCRAVIRDNLTETRTCDRERTCDRSFMGLLYWREKSFDEVSKLLVNQEFAIVGSRWRLDTSWSKSGGSGTCCADCRGRWLIKKSKSQKHMLRNPTCPSTRTRMKVITCEKKEKKIARSSSALSIRRFFGNISVDRDTLYVSVLKSDCIHRRQFGTSFVSQSSWREEIVDRIGACSASNPYVSAYDLM